MSLIKFKQWIPGTENLCIKVVFTNWRFPLISNCVFAGKKFDIYTFLGICTSASKPR
jgi:hypothetical protein